MRHISDSVQHGAEPINSDGIGCLSHRRIQEEELAILDSFLLFCDAHGLTTTPIGGTMLGAARHGGFIPWDDDIDMGMPRPDYESLISLGNELESETGLSLRGYASVEVGISPYCKLVNPKIEVQPEREAAHSYLWIDIMPIDALPSDDSKLSRLYSRARRRQRVLMFLTSTPESSSSSTRRFLKRMGKPLRRMPLVARWAASSLSRLGQRLKYASTPYVGVLTWGMYGPGERFSLSGMEQMSSVNFEGRNLACMSCWDDYLSGIYGDYMQLPPKAKRVNHGMKAWYVTESEEQA